MGSPIGSDKVQGLQVHQINADAGLIENGRQQGFTFFQSVLLGLAAADVARDGDKNAMPVDADATGAHLGVINRAVLAAMVGFERGIDREDIGEPGTDIRLGHVRVHIPGIETGHLFRRVAHHLGKASIDLDDSVVLVKNGDAIVGILDQRSAPFSFVCQCQPACLLSADVAPDGHAVIPTVQANDPNVDLDIEDIAIFAAVPVVEAGTTGRLHPRYVRAQSRFVQVGLDIQQRKPEHFLAAVAQHPTGCVVDLDEAQGFHVH